MYCYSLPKYLVNEIERVQKRALKIMCPSLSYNEALTHMEKVPLSVHHSNICTTLFNEILSDSDHRLRAFLPPSHQACKYSLRRTSKFDIPKVNTKRARIFFSFFFNINTAGYKLVLYFVNSFSNVIVLYYIALRISFREFYIIIIIYYMASSVSGQDEPNRALWFSPLAGKMEPSCPLGTTRGSRKQNFTKSHIRNPLLTQFVHNADR